MFTSTLHWQPRPARCALLGLFLFAAAFSGCKKSAALTSQPSAQNPSDATASQRPLSVIATVFPLADMVMHIGGSHVVVDWMIKGTQEPEDFTPTDLQRRQLATADLILTSGYPEDWADQAFSQSIRQFHVIRPENTAAARALFRYLRSRAQLRDSTRPRNPTHTESYASALWLDPLVARELIGVICEHLVAIDSANAAEYRGNSEEYQRSFDAALAEFGVSLDISLEDNPAMTQPSMPEARQFNSPDDPSISYKVNRIPGIPAFLSVRSFWSPLARRCGWQELSPVDRAPWNLQDSDFQVLRRVAAENDIHLLAVSTIWPTGVRENLQDQTRLPLLMLDPMGVAEGGYLPMLRYNLTRLREARATLARPGGSNPPGS